VSHLGQTRDHINKVFKSANITRNGVVHPAVNVNEEKGPLRLANRVDGSRSL
jgi:hypothetical protein